MLLYVVCKPMDIHGYTDIRRIWICSAIYAHGYFRRRGTVRLMDLDLDLVLQYPSKPAPLPSARQLCELCLEKIIYLLNVFSRLVSLCRAEPKPAYRLAVRAQDDGLEI
jgi:hypothetical protein